MTVEELLKKIEKALSGCVNPGADFKTLGESFRRAMFHKQKELIKSVACSEKCISKTLYPEDVEELPTLEELRNDLRSIVNDLNNQISLKAAELNECKGRVQNMEGNVAQLQEQQRKLREELNTTNQQKTQLQDAIQRLNKQIADNSEEVQRAKQSVKALTDELTEERKLLEEAQKHLQTLNEQIASLGGEVNTKNNRITELEAQNRRLSDELEAEKAKAPASTPTDLADSLRKLQQKLKVCEGTRDIYSAGVDALNANVRALLQQAEVMKQICDQRQAQITLLIQQLEAEKAKKPGSSVDVQESDDYKKLNELYQEEVQAANQCNERLEAANQRITEQINDITENHKIIDQLQKQIEDLRKEIPEGTVRPEGEPMGGDELQAALTTCTNNLERERQNYKELEAQKTEQQNLAALYKAEAAQLKAKVQQLEAEKLKLQQDLSREVDLNEDCADEIDELKQEKADLTKARDREREEAERCKQEKVQALKDRDKAREDLLKAKYFFQADKLPNTGANRANNSVNVGKNFYNMLKNGNDMKRALIAVITDYKNRVRSRKENVRAIGDKWNYVIEDIKKILAEGGFELTPDEVKFADSRKVSLAVRSNIFD